MTKYTIIHYTENDKPELSSFSTIVYSGFDKEFAMKVFDYYVLITGYTTVSEEYVTRNDILTKI